jgi:Arc/MetJ-type ribon-helix-helix transcriptional regulator
MKPTRAGMTENVSVSMPADLVSELRSRAGRRGVSSYVADAVRHQLAMDGLAEIVAAHEEEHGALTEQEIEAASRELFGGATARSTGQDAA